MNGLARRPEASARLHVQLVRRSPRWASVLPKPGSSGAAGSRPRRRPLAAHPRRWVVVGVSHSEAAQDAAAPGHSTRVTSRVACHPNAPKARDRCGGCRRPRRAGREPGEQRVLQPRGVGTPDQPVPSSSRPIVASATAATGAPRRLAVRSPTSTAAGPGSVSPVGGDPIGCDARRASHARRQPGEATTMPIHGLTHDWWTSHASSPAQNAAAVVWQRTSVHTVANGRICSRSHGRCR